MWGAKIMRNVSWFSGVAQRFVVLDKVRRIDRSKNKSAHHEKLFTLSNNEMTLALRCIRDVIKIESDLRSYLS